MDTLESWWSVQTSVKVWMNGLLSFQTETLMKAVGFGESLVVTRDGY